jgi:hypothetical protein
VRDHAEDVFLRAEPNEERVQQRRFREVERTRRVLGCKPPRLGLRLLGPEVAEVAKLESERRRGRYSLDRLAVHELEPRPQHLVACDELVQGPLERFLIEVALQPEGRRDVVLDAAAVELRQEPESALREGGRQRVLFERASFGCCMIDDGCPKIRHLSSEKT